MPLFRVFGDGKPVADVIAMSKYDAIKYVMEQWEGEVLVRPLPAEFTVESTFTGPVCWL